MTSPTKPQRYSSSCARMLCAVAAASLSTTSLLRTQIANPSVVPIQAKTPAILAWKRGDVLTVGSVILDPSSYDPDVTRRVCSKGCVSEPNWDPLRRRSCSRLGSDSGRYRVTFYFLGVGGLFA